MNAHESPDAERFESVMERIDPEPGSFDTASMARGEPGFPHAFAWRGTTYRVAAVVRTWRELSAPDSDGRNRYVRRHGVEIRTTQGDVMLLTGERSGQGARWWVRGIAQSDAERCD